MKASINAKSLEKSKSALVCCSDEWRVWVSNNSPYSESCKSTSPCNPLEFNSLPINIRETQDSIIFKKLVKNWIWDEIPSY